MFPKLTLSLAIWWLRAFPSLLIITLNFLRFGVPDCRVSAPARLLSHHVILLAQIHVGQSRHLHCRYLMLSHFHRLLLPLSQKSTHRMGSPRGHHACEAVFYFTIRSAFHHQGSSLQSAHRSFLGSLSRKSHVPKATQQLHVMSHQ